MNETLGLIFGTSKPATYDNARSNSLIEAHGLPNTLTWPDPKILIGIEVEAENVLIINNNLTLGWWQIENDSSLRNNGREFKTYPMACRYTQPALEFLFKYINTSIDFSKRTSIHFHLNVRDLTVNQLAGLFITYLPFENLFFQFADLSRRTNLYCVPIVETDLLDAAPHEWKALLSNISLSWHKYSALNLLPITNFGTVEFRHMPGTNDVIKLCNWVRLITRLKLAAKRYDYVDLLKIICALNTTSGYHEFLNMIFEQDAELFNTNDLKSLMEKPVALIKSSMLANEFNSTVLKQVTNFSNFYKIRNVSLTTDKKELFDDAIQGGIHLNMADIPEILPIDPAVVWDDD